MWYFEVELYAYTKGDLHQIKRMDLHTPARNLGVSLKNCKDSILKEIETMTEEIMEFHGIPLEKVNHDYSVKVWIDELANPPQISRLELTIDDRSLAHPEIRLTVGMAIQQSKFE